ncbi:MAG: DUF2341 domain-containing protein [Candidatus Bathyarchaeia archaeon]
MESKVDSDNAVFWVEVADDLSSQDRTIYVYYGKSDATYPYLASDQDGTRIFNFPPGFKTLLISLSVHKGSLTCSSTEKM